MEMEILFLRNLSASRKKVVINFETPQLRDYFFSLSYLSVFMVN